MAKIGYIFDFPKCFNRNLSNYLIFSQYTPIVSLWKERLVETGKPNKEEIFAALCKASKYLRTCIANKILTASIVVIPRTH